MNTNNIKICKLCGKKVSRLNMHINHSHKEYSENHAKKYFDTFIEPYEHKCIICGTDAKYLRFSKGYSLFCSKKCLYKYLGKKASIRQTGVSRLDLKGKHRSLEDIEKIKIGRRKFLNSERGIQYKKYLSERMMGEKNSSHKMSEETKRKAIKKQSNSIKEKIAKGEFTPCITNSWANSKTFLKINGFNYYYRSSWDAAFQILNPTFEYEKIRIKYNLTKTDTHVYIIDFVDEKTKTIYEIKPEVLIESKKNKIKAKAAIDWCKKNGYNYKIISNSYFKQNAKNIDFSKYDEKIYKGMKQFL